MKYPRHECVSQKRRVWHAGYKSIIYNSIDARAVDHSHKFGPVAFCGIFVETRIYWSLPPLRGRVIIYELRVRYEDFRLVISGALCKFRHFGHFRLKSSLLCASRERVDYAFRRKKNEGEKKQTALYVGL